MSLATHLIHVADNPTLSIAPMMLDNGFEDVAQVVGYYRYVEEMGTRWKLRGRETV